MRRAAQHALAAFGREIGPAAHPEEKAHQAGRSIDNRGIDNLPLARLLSLIKRSEDAEGAIHRSTAEIADKVLGRDRRLA